MMKQTDAGHYELQLLQAIDRLEAARLQGDFETPIEEFMTRVFVEHTLRVRKVLRQIDLDLQGRLPASEEEANELDLNGA